MHNCIFILIGALLGQVAGQSDAQRLLEHLMTGYNKLIRPVHNHTDVVTVRLELKVTNRPIQ